mgnify:CR=1 FL=1
MSLGAKALLLTTLLPYTALAVEVAPAPITTLPQLTSKICVAINWIFTFLIIIAIIFVLIAAFKYLTAAGDPEKVKAASHTLVYAAVAVAVAIVAKGVPLIVGNFFGTAFTGCA